MPDFLQGTTVELFEQIPLEADYENTVLFENEEAQNEYFSTYPANKKHRYLNQSYHRWTVNKIRIQDMADKLYDCNYIRFRNTTPNSGTHYANKWFYGFISNIEYINENTTEVTYEIDYMQTWLPAYREIDGSAGSKYVGDVVNENDYEIGQVFVEREHSIEDILYDNRIPENITKGEYVGINPEMPIITTGKKFTSNLGMAFIFPVTSMFDIINWKPYPSRHPDFKPLAGVQEDHVIWHNNAGDIHDIYNMPLNLYAVFIKLTNNDGDIITVAEPSSSYAKTISEWLRLYIEDNPTFGEECVSSFIFPYELFGCAINEYDPQSDVGILNTIRSNGKYNYLNKKVKIGNDTFEFEGYHPKNNKLYIYPYRKILADNGYNDVKEYRFEGWKDATDKNTVEFNIFGTNVPTCNMYCVPTNYFGVNGDGDYSEAISTGELNNIPLSVDAFELWKLRNQYSVGASIVTNYLKGFASIISSVGSENPMSGVPSAISSFGAVAQNITGMIDKYNSQEDKLVNMTNNEYIRTAQVRWQINLREYTIRKEFAEIIDSYFDKFGYATKITKIPNIYSRPQWNYIKTNGCFLHKTKMPVTAEKKICEIYNKGITFWHNPNNVGEYDIPNPAI